MAVTPARRVLMLCYYFPPIIASGVTRSVSFARNLTQFGWTPVVLTVSKSRDPWVSVGTATVDEVETHRSPEWNLAWVVDTAHAVLLRIGRLLRIALRANYFRETVALPDTQIAWFSTLPGIRFGHAASVLYASCSPFSSAVSACLMKLILRKPLVIDFRDAWSVNPGANYGGYHRAMVDLLERFVVATCDRLILNTEGALALYEARYPDARGKLLCIPNGYDRLTPVTRQRAPERFTITHVGNFYGNRLPDTLLEALAGLQHLPIDFLQVGQLHPAFARFATRVRLKVTGIVSHEEALAAMSQASLLYLRQGFERGVTYHIAVAAKTYEYLATGLPILAELPPGDNAEIVRRYAKNAYLVTTEDPAAIRDMIERAYAVRDNLRPEIDPDFIVDFDRARLAGRLAAVLDQLVSSPSNLVPAGIGGSRLERGSPT